MPRHRFQLALGTLIAALAVFAALVAGSARLPALATPTATPPPTLGPLPVASIWPGQNFSDVALALARLDQTKNERHIRIDYTRGECVSERAEDILVGNKRRKKSCFSEIRLTGQDYDLTVNLIEDYPNNPGKMCVYSVEYDPHNFQNNASAFIDATDRTYGPAPFKDDSTLDGEITREYPSPLPTCYRENNCFTPIDQCLVAERCREVSASRTPVRSADPTTYVRSQAHPYQVQQTAYATIATEAALEQSAHALNAVATPSPAAMPICSIAAILIPPWVAAYADKLPDVALPRSPDNLPPHTKVLTANTNRLLIEEYSEASGFEIITYLRASGEWKVIWRIQGPTALSAGAFKELVARQRGNDGWSEEPIGNNYTPPSPSVSP